MPPAFASKPPLAAALIGAVLVLALAAAMSRPFVRLGLVAGGVPEPSGPSAVASSDLRLPLAPTGGGAPMTIAVRLWYPSGQRTLTAAPAIVLPLILYAPAWGGRRDDNKVLCANLASHGFLVAAFDDISHDPLPLAASADDIAARLTGFDVATDAERQRILAVASRRAALAAAKASAVLDAIGQSPSPLPRGLAADLSRAGIIGASFGGATAAETAQRDPRIRAAINLDGLLFGQAAVRPIQVPFAEFNSSRGAIHPKEIASANPLRRWFAAQSAKDIAIIQRQLAARSDSINLTIRGASHGDYMDELYDPSRWKQWRPWRGAMIAPDRMRYITDAYVTAFFAQHLNGKPTPLLRQRPSPFPEVTIDLGH